MGTAVISDIPSHLFYGDPLPCKRRSPDYAAAEKALIEARRRVRRDEGRYRMQLEDYQRVRVDQIASQRGWVCQRCGSALSSAGLAYEIPDGRVAVELRCTNRGEPHPEGREVSSMALSDDEAGVAGILVRRGTQTFRPKGARFPYASD